MDNRRTKVVSFVPLDESDCSLLQIQLQEQLKGEINVEFSSIDPDIVFFLCNGNPSRYMVLQTNSNVIEEEMKRVGAKNMALLFIGCKKPVSETYYHLVSDFIVDMFGKSLYTYLENNAVFSWDVEASKDQLFRLCSIILGIPLVNKADYITVGDELPYHRRNFLSKWGVSYFWLVLLAYSALSTAVWVTVSAILSRSPLRYYKYKKLFLFPAIFFRELFM